MIGKLMREGYGWEDICVRVGIWKYGDEGKDLRRLVLRL